MNEINQYFLLTHLLVRIDPTFIVLCGIFPSFPECLHFDKRLSSYFRSIVGFMGFGWCLKCQRRSGFY